MKAKHIFLTIISMMMLTACMDKEWEVPDLTEPAYGNNSIQQDATKQVTIDQLKTAYATVISGSGFSFLIFPSAIS